MLGSPNETAYDLRFRLLGIPVRVHPLFWLVMLMISPDSKELLGASIFIGSAFVSILVHEFGHGLSSRWLGREPGGIVLYAMGGFCYYDAAHQSPWKRLIVLASGPGAGFLLAGLVLWWGLFRFGINPGDALALVGIGGGDYLVAALRLPPSMPLRHAFFDLLYINVWWGIFNLFPIWPLDGGQMTQTTLGMVNPTHGVRWSHVISLLTAAAFALFRASQGDYLSALWIGSFAFLNYQVLQSMHDQYRASRSEPW